MKNLIILDKPIQLIKTTTMKPILFLFFLFFIGNEAYSQNIKPLTANPCFGREGSTCLTGFVKEPLDPDCIGKSCIPGIKIDLEQNILKAEATVFDMNMNEVSIQTKEISNAKNCMNQLWVDVKDFSGFAFLKLYKEGTDGSFISTTIKIYIIDSNDSDKKIVNDYKIGKSSSHPVVRTAPTKP